eukprot:CAMPEP_0171915558 /NCGR_PEP_ID=MMETSP0993-20121228/13970_1 /TAXON_ID=483369 /ORGANISM="non described non described, Strain CCMP2098" /LENGTH=42 /DNA_ID= /DNA_START= /DNA_END= /DNA_ORIENTATION=
MHATEQAHGAKLSSHGKGQVFVVVRQMAGTANTSSSKITGSA